MKKFVLFFAIMLVLPCIITLLYTLFDNGIKVGKGSYSLEQQYMGKSVMLEINGLYKSMDVEEYVLGVLPGTIPADYDTEALKVQAILIRTNLLKEMLEKNTEDGADLSYCYLPVEERRELWGERNYDKYERKCKEAVACTAGRVIEQEGNLITAFYHAVSIGKTASAKEVLGTDISYLQSVESSQDVEAKHYMNVIFYSDQELRKRIQDFSEYGKSEKSDTGNPVELQVEESTENGFVKKISVDGTGLSGKDAMDIFGLPSTNFYVERQENGYRFICLGKGECLGVSQYGANRMALNGKKYEEIINYYYQGVSLVDSKNQTRDE